jgi:aminopeptidase N
MPTNFLRLPFALSLLCSAIVAARADDFTAEIQCQKSLALFAPPDSPDRFKYAPDREINILHLALDVTPDFKQRTVEGSATFRFKPIAKPVRELKLDAVDLNIRSVTSTEKIQGYQSTSENVIVTFVDAIPADKEASITIAYQAEPTLGLYFRTPEMGYKEGDTHLFSQGEEIEARHWYPCFDSPNQKFTSEVTCHVPDGMVVVSNGRLVSQEKDAPTGLVAVHWSQEKPHANYLITLVAGYFKKLEDRHKDVPLAFYALPSDFDQAANSFRDTKAIMAFFEEEIGVPYPWAKYDQICVNDFVAGGMENTSATTLTDGTLFTAATENIRDSRSLVAHEMAHQWFGDLVTCKDWSHIWLNEGFATYYETLFEGRKNGHDAWLYDLYGNARQVLDQPNDTNAIVRRNYDSPGEMFGYLAYPKGAWVLHMLRSQLGADLYRRCIRTYLEWHQFANVTTEDLRAVIEELSGRSYDQFFDQWLYHAHHPELDVSYSWDEKTKLAKISIKQTQKISENILLFNFPLTIRFNSKSGAIDRSIDVKEKEQDFYFPLDAAPESVRLDPEYTLLAKITFNVPNAMLYAQLANKSDVIGRLRAIEQLSTKTDKQSVAHLKDALNDDPFYGVRVEASRALRTIHTDEAFDALLASTKQPDARVRRQVTVDIGNFYREAAAGFARKSVTNEANPLIVSEAITSLGGYAQPEVREILLRYLNSNSYRNELAAAAINAVRLQDDPAYLTPLQQTLTRREAEFTSRAFAQGLGTLAYLDRNEDRKDAVREFLVGYVNHKKQNVQLAAIRALDTLGDPKAIAVLDKFATAAKDSPQRTAAERAVTNLRAGRRPVDDFKNLRTEVLDLQKQNRDLKKQMDGLEKKLDALTTKPAPASKKSTAVKSPKESGR